MIWARTDRAKYLFRVSEGGSPDQLPYITLEPRDKGLRTLKDCLFALDLKSGTTIKEAEEIARFLNAKVEAISITVLSEEPPA